MAANSATLMGRLYEIRDTITSAVNPSCRFPQLQDTPHDGLTAPGISVSDLIYPIKVLRVLTTESFHLIIYLGKGSQEREDGFLPTAGHQYCGSPPTGTGLCSVTTDL